MVQSVFSNGLCSFVNAAGHEDCFFCFWEDAVVYFVAFWDQLKLKQFSDKVSPKQVSKSNWINLDNVFC